ncbi:hypothetical protein RUM43_000576 [Polyplax serrata]|uniref:Metalloendopeptidase n=1 Tax=Polyplax serrata TaxID=468196 RepID=A0AAN8SDJ3_POLSC
MELRSITILLAVLLCLISFSNGKLFGSSALNYPWDENQIESSSSNEVSNSEDDDIINRKFEEMNDLPLGTPEEEKNVPGEPLTPEDFRNAKTMKHEGPVMDENTPDPIQSAGLFEGDIAGVNISDVLSSGRNGIRDMNLRWPGGVIPYVISAQFDSRERGVIAAAFHDYQTKTCIRFVPRTQQRDYIYILKGSGCSSLVGRNGHKQQVSLGPGCVYKGVIIHELMHATGFWHEQSRPDRDDYVVVLWQNIIPGMEFNFNKYDWNTVQGLGVSYDTGSVMHYTRNSFSRDGRSPTIIPRHGDGDFLGQRIGFSEKDLIKINKLYECGGGGQTIEETTLKPVQPTGECEDNHRFCSYWSRRGECSKNPNWMLANCKKSCNQCAKKCNNYNKDCEFWAKIGECTKNPSYMTIYCAQSCNTCHIAHRNETSTCTDNNQYCPAWAADNQCAVNPNYMLIYCRRSCRQC